MLSVEHYCSPIGELEIRVEDHKIVYLNIAHEMDDCPNETTNEAVKQLKEYFVGERQIFNLPLNYQGTPFRKSVWAALETIPFGELKTYGDVAKMVNNPQGARAIGQAVHYNPIIIMVPCHRVVASNGLGGFGCGKEVKKKLLEIEGHQAYVSKF